MNTSDGPLDYLAAFAIVLAAGGLLGLALGWGGTDLLRRLQRHADDV